MRDPLHQFWAKFEEISLPAAKKAEGLAVLKTALQLMREGKEIASLDPARKASVLQQLAQERSESAPSVGWFAGQFSVRYWLRIPAIAVLAIFIATGTCAIGAEAALPGDVLYPLKISVTEPIMGAFHLSPESRAAWEVQLLERRVHEAERAARERLGDLESIRRAREAVRGQADVVAGHIEVLSSPVTQAAFREQVGEIFSQSTEAGLDTHSSSSVASSSVASSSSSLVSSEHSASSISSSESSFSARSTYSVPNLRPTYSVPSLRQRHSYSVPNLHKP